MRKARGPRFLPFAALVALVTTLLLLVTGTAGGQIPGLPGYGSTTTAPLPTTTTIPPATTTTLGGNQNAQGNQQNGQQNAQQNAQGNPGNAPSGPDTTVDLGTHNVGDSFNFTFGGFTPGEVINLIFNGVLEQGTKTADSNGRVDLTVIIYAIDRIDTDDIMTNGRCGPNDLVARGQRSGTRATTNFNIDCSAAAAGGNNGNNGPGGNNGAGGAGGNNGAGGAGGNNGGFGAGGNNGGLGAGGNNGGLGAGGLGAAGAAGGTGGLSNGGGGVLGSIGGIPNGAYFGPNGSLLAPDGTVILPSGAVPLGLYSGTGPAAGSVLATPSGAGTNANLGNGVSSGAAGASGSRGSNGRSSTAFTGSNVMRLTLIGLVCIALGWQLTRLRRRGILS